MSDQDLSYYRHRADTEIALAARATRPEAAAAHRQLATAYLERVSAGEDRKPHHA